jgi:hypothetical protein
MLNKSKNGKIMTRIIESKAKPFHHKKKSTSNVFLWNFHFKNENSIKRRYLQIFFFGFAMFVD